MRLIRCVVVLAAVLLGGCSVYGGLSMHSRGADAPEYNGTNPLGHFGARAEFTERLTGFCEHLSSIPDYEAGLGLNRCGVEVEVDLFPK